MFEDKGVFILQGVCLTNTMLHLTLSEIFVLNKDILMQSTIVILVTDTILQLHSRRK